MIKSIEFPFKEGLVTRNAFEAHKILYQGYVKKFNEISDLLKNEEIRKKADKNYSYYRGLKRDETFNLDSIILHELYFRNLETNNKHDFSKKFVDIAERYFKSFDNWHDDFVAAAKSSRGWVVTCFEQRTETLRNIVVDSHDIGIIQSAYPVLVIDCWEHVWMTDYPANQNEYVDCFMECINWKIVDERVKSLVLEGN